MTPFTDGISRRRFFSGTLETSNQAGCDSTPGATTTRFEPNLSMPPSEPIVCRRSFSSSWSADVTMVLTGSDCTGLVGLCPHELMVIARDVEHNPIRHDVSSVVWDAGNEIN